MRLTFRFDKNVQKSVVLIHDEVSLSISTYVGHS